MTVIRKRIIDNLQRVRDDIVAAAERVRRDPADIRLIAVTKAVEIDDIKTLIDLGVRDLGENRARQIVERAEVVSDWLARRRKETSEAICWHMIGHLQRNKVKSVLPVAAMIHSVDTLRLAEEIDRRAAAAGLVGDILLEVNCSGEAQKFGVPVGAAAHMVDQINTMNNLRIIGLMTMAPLVADAEKARPTFVRLRELFEDMRLEKIGGKDFQHLSMGMSQDYEVAVEEGATILRIGTALFE
ncbi:MAG: YggS family pyridoxal phosphate-dependent enzyme [Planctomycetota bacterium]|nr:YggS family pyridoxal phosphate-dependent enzyme [Planctomycetota bacterium]